MFTVVAPACNMCLLSVCFEIVGSSMDALWELHPRRLSEAGLSRHSGIDFVLVKRRLSPGCDDCDQVVPQTIDGFSIFTF